MIETILVATDGSEDGNAAEQTAMGLASRLRIKLTAISVVDERRFRAPAGAGLNLPPFPEAEVASYYRARADAVARRFNERARGEGLDATCEVLQGPCDDRIVERVQAADLL
jgi:nucleotide-binding universal stress UspA family protein